MPRRPHQVLRRLQQLVALGLVRQGHPSAASATSAWLRRHRRSAVRRLRQSRARPRPRLRHRPRPLPPDPEQERFQLQLGIDVEAERVLLFRVGIVLELLALLTLLRQILLTYLEP